MTVDTLLPKASNMQSNVYGSAEDGFGIVNSWKYNATQKKWQITKSKNYMPGTDEKDEVKEVEEETKDAEETAEAPAEAAADSIERQHDTVDIVLSIPYRCFLP